MLFEGNERRRLECQMKEAGRLPPGQSLTLKWPVLHYGSVPRFDPEAWDFRIFGEVESPVRWTWAEFERLPTIEITRDMHCVTRWSKFDNRWKGVAFREVLARARRKPGADYVMVHGEQGYTANVPLAELEGDDVLFSTHHNGERLTADHGYPLRLVIPRLYAWKSVKWVRGLELLTRNAPGFWERNGYHMDGDPWKEQRFDR